MIDRLVAAQLAQLARRQATGGRGPARSSSGAHTAIPHTRNRHPTAHRQDALESLLHIGGLQRTRLDEGQALALAERLQAGRAVLFTRGSLRCVCRAAQACSARLPTSSWRLPQTQTMSARPAPMPPFLRSIGPHGLQEAAAAPRPTLASSVCTERRWRRSLLLPTSMMTMLASAWSRSSLSHRSTFSNVVCLVMSYTSSAPTAPR